MFIEVRFGHNESIICNPYCIVVNLMNNIRERTGFTRRTMTLDLSDETGLVKDLDLHRLDKADKYLTNQGPYILVEKQALTDDYDPVNAPHKAPQYNYIPLLEGYEDLFPQFKVHVPQVAAAEKKKTKQRHQSPSPSVAKSASPAGKRPKKKTAKKK